MMFAERVFRPLSAVVQCACLVLPLISQAPDARIPQAPPQIQVDGRRDDWTHARLIRDPKSGAEIGFENDGRHLYVLFVASKPEARESLESTGLTVLARPRGAKISTGVLFLVRSVPPEAYIRWHESQGVFMTDGEKMKLGETARHDLCLTFAVGARGSTHGPLRRLRNSLPPEFGVSRAEAGMIFELKIPLASPTLVPGGIGIAPGETARISFEWGGAQKKVLGAQSTRVTPPAEAGELSGGGETWAQEYLNSFDLLSRPTTGTRRYAFAVDVKMADAK